jgi:RNA polymerase sigma-70 factor (ECF subfamily)
VLLRVLLSASFLPAVLLPAGGRKAGCTRQRQVLLEVMKDAIATENVWHALGAELRGFLRSRVPSDSDADDLLQDVFVRVYENIGSLRQAGRVESWVYQIARNAVADFYRRRTPPTADTVDDATDLQVGGGATQNQNRAVGAWLSLMIDQLPQTLRDAVQMYEIDGRSQAEISDRLGISLSAVKSRVRRGRRQLQELLRGSCQLERDRRGNVIACKPASDTGCAQVSCDCDDDVQSS